MTSKPIITSVFLLLACSQKDATSTGLSQVDTAMPNQVVPIDLTDPNELSMAFARTRGSLDPDESVFYYWTGLIYDRTRADPNEFTGFNYGSPILRFEGFNVARFVPVEDGVFDMVTREINVYQNLNGDIIDCWYNAQIGVEDPKRVPVVHVQNDPVNFQISGADVIEMGDHIIFPMEVIISYDSPLPLDRYAQYSAGNTYESSELFNFYTTREALENPD